MHNRRYERPAVRPNRPARAWKRYFLWGLAGLAGLFVLGNAGVWLVYKGKLPMNMYVGATKVGGTPFNEIDQRLATVPLPEIIDVEYEDGTLSASEISPAAAGFTPDEAAMKQALLAQKRGLPIAWLFRKKVSPLVVKTDEQKFVEGIKPIGDLLYKAPEPKRVVFASGSFSIADASPGRQLDTTRFQTSLKEAIEQGKPRLTAQTVPLQPPEPTVNVEAERQKLQKYLARKIEMRLNGQNKRASAGDIGGWFAPDGSTMTLSAERVKAYLATIGSARNMDDAVSAIQYAFNKSQDITFVLAPSATKVTYKYCVMLKGVDASHREGFVQKVAATLGDPRGWGADGKVSFERAEGGCNFDIWLSAPQYMTGFGSVCDSYYSCRVGRNVVINFDRWQGATDPWNAAGGSLEDYRVMVINHETGHWLGFGHLNCPGPGQPAPVMQQQSINLQGCKFNPWPTAGELTTMKQARGIAMLPAREEFVVEAACCCSHCAA